MEVKASNGAYIETGDMVLVRESDTSVWFVSLFSYKIKDNYFICTNGSVWAQCIPLEGNEHLCGTNNMYEEHYIPKFGDMVEGITSKNEKIDGVLVEYSHNEDIKGYDDERVKYKVVAHKFMGDGFAYNYYPCKSVKPIKKQLTTGTEFDTLYLLVEKTGGNKMENLKKVSQEEFLNTISRFGNNVTFNENEEESSFRKSVFVWTTRNGIIVGKAIGNGEYLKEFFLVEK